MKKYLFIVLASSLFFSTSAFAQDSYAISNLPNNSYDTGTHYQDPHPNTGASARADYTQNPNASVGASHGVTTSKEDLTTNTVMDCILRGNNCVNSNINTWR